MSVGYHCTTPRKLARYRLTGGILPPVRFFDCEAPARAWGQRTGRTVIVTFDRPEPSYPLPDHRPSHWTPMMVRAFRVLP